MLDGPARAVSKPLPALAGHKDHCDLPEFVLLVAREIVEHQPGRESQVTLQFTKVVVTGRRDLAHEETPHRYDGARIRYRL